MTPRHGIVPRPYAAAACQTKDVCPAERNRATVSLMTLTEPAPSVGTAADPASRATLTSVRNAARVLRAVLPGRPGSSVSPKLARQLGLGKSTVHRLVTTLTAERLLERGSTPGRYRLGLVLYELGSNVTEHVDLHQAALPGDRHAAARDRRDGARGRARRARGGVRGTAGEPQPAAGSSARSGTGCRRTGRARARSCWPRCRRTS